MKTYLVTNIDYDFDEEIVDLPTEFKIKVPNNVDDIYDYISNEISNLTGFCVNCFDTTMKDSWSREDVILLCKKAFYQGQLGEGCTASYISFENWLEKNL